MPHIASMANNWTFLFGMIYILDNDLVSFYSSLKLLLFFLCNDFDVMVYGEGFLFSAMLC
jgi:hypothetical protein